VIAEGTARLREDVHIHAPYGALRDKLLDFDSHADWLAEPFRGFRAVGDACSFNLALPLRLEGARLRREVDEPYALTFSRGAGAIPPDDEGRAVESVEGITWAMHPEGPDEVHLTVEYVYAPAGGMLGLVLENALHKPHRRQAFRDSLWNLKQSLERDHLPGASAAR
jgi:hypothetical protein